MDNYIKDVLITWSFPLLSLLLVYHIVVSYNQCRGVSYMNTHTYTHANKQKSPAVT